MSRSETERYKPRPKTLIFCGNPRLPEKVTAKYVFGYLSIELEVDPLDLKIVDVSCTLLPTLGEKVLINALMGYEIEEGVNTIKVKAEKAEKMEIVSIFVAVALMIVLFFESKLSIYSSGEKSQGEISIQQNNLEKEENRLSGRWHSVHQTSGQSGITTGLLTPYFSPNLCFENRKKDSHK